MPSGRAKVRLSRTGAAQRSSWVCPRERSRFSPFPDAEEFKGTQIHVKDFPGGLRLSRRALPNLPWTRAQDRPGDDDPSRPFGRFVRRGAGAPSSAAVKPEAPEAARPLHLPVKQQTLFFGTGASAMQMTDLQDLFVDNLKDLYSAEKQMLRAMPKLAKAVESEELRAAFQKHAKETEQQVQRLEQIFDRLGTSPRGKKCKGMEG